MVRTIRKFFKHGRIYSRWIGFKEAVFFVIAECTNSTSLRLINIANEQLYVRTAAPDLRIAANWLVAAEYDSIESSNASVIIDARAHIGISSIYFAKKYPGAKVFAIEPEQENYDLLLKNINRYKNIIPIHAALWGQQSIRPIQNRLTGSWGYTVSETTNKTLPTGQQVCCITIGSLLDKYDLDTIDILKMDIEGSEKNVLENSEDWIDKVKIITAELHDRICMGCDRAFYLATREFARFEKDGEKVTAYRK